jgi:uncharacterized membrane protein
MVFGVALSIGALTLINNISSSATAGSIIGSIVLFGFSFLILMSLWFRYTKVLELMNIETRIEVNLNILVLFLVAIEPYLFYLLNTNTAGLLNLTSSLYALDIAALLLVLYTFYRIGIKSKKDSKSGIKDYYKPTSEALLIGGVLFGISAFPFFWNINILGVLQLRFAIWIVAFVLGNFRGHFGKYFRRAK